MNSADENMPLGFEEPKQVSRLAIASLILSLVFCCPLTTLAGIITGSIAVIKTMHNQALTGRWMAILAIIISLAGTGLQISDVSWVYYAVFKPIMIGPETAIQVGEAGDIAAFQSHFVTFAANQSADDDAKEFLATLKDRYGAFQGASLDQGSTPTKIPNAGEDFTGDYQLDFAKGRIRCTCTFEIGSTQGELSMRIKEIVIQDADHGDLTYPLNDDAKPQEKPTATPKAEIK